MINELLIAAAKKRAGGGSYRYLRLYITAANSFPVIADLYWTVGATDYPLVNMSSNTTPSPLVASGFRTGGANIDPWRAFNRAGGSEYWDTGIGGPWWLQIDLGAGNKILPTAVGIAPHFTYWPTSFTCLGSNTGAFTGEHTELKAVTGATTGWTAYTRRNFTF